MNCSYLCKILPKSKLMFTEMYQFKIYNNKFVYLNNNTFFLKKKFNVDT